MNLKEFHAHLREAFPSAITSSCLKKGCKLTLEGIPQSSLTIIDADEYRRTHGHADRICDYLLFFTNERKLYVIPVEMKSGKVDAGTAVAQLQRGADVCDEILREFPPSPCPSELLPILLYGGGIRSMELKVLRRSRISFRGEEYPITYERCGHSLKNILRL